MHRFLTCRSSAVKGQLPSNCVSHVSLPTLSESVAWTGDLSCWSTAQKAGKPLRIRWHWFGGAVLWRTYFSSRVTAGETKSWTWKSMFSSCVCVCVCVCFKDLFPGSSCMPWKLAIYVCEVRTIWGHPQLFESIGISVLWVWRRSLKWGFPSFPGHGMKVIILFRFRFWWWQCNE